MASAEESMKCPYESQSVSVWRTAEADQAVKELQRGTDMHKVKREIPIA
jgi:hypothetical protein